MFTTMHSKFPLLSLKRCKQTKRWRDAWAWRHARVPGVATAQETVQLCPRCQRWGRTDELVDAHSCMHVCRPVGLFSKGVRMYVST